MTISKGDSLPAATLIELTSEGPAQVNITERVAGKTVVIFGVPGAFTSTCTSAHVPSFIRTKGDFDAKGVDHVICVSVNDPFVMKTWSETTGAGEAGILFLGDASAEFTKAIGMNFTAPPVGFYDRCQRFSLYAEDGVIKVLNVEAGPGQCEISAGETLLAAI